MIRITKLAINLAGENTHNLLAYVNIVFEDCFIVRGIRVVQRPEGGRLVLMPSRQNKAGDFKDVAHPITQDFRSQIEKEVLDRVAGMMPEK